MNIQEKKKRREPIFVKVNVVTKFDMDCDSSLLELQKLQTGEVTSCDLNVNHLLAIGSSDKSIRVLEWKTGLGYVDMFYSPLSFHNYPITCVKFSPKGTMLVSSSVDGTADLIDVSTGNRIFTMVQCNKSNIRFCEFSFDCTELITAADDGILCFWDLIHHCQIRNCRLHEDDFSLKAFAVSPDSEYLLSIDSGNLLKLWCISNNINLEPSVLFIRKGVHDEVTCCDFSPVKNITGTAFLKFNYCISTCGADSLIKVWNVTIEKDFSRGTNLKSFKCDLVLIHILQHDRDVLSVKFNCSGNFLVSTGLDSSVKLWKVHDGICIKILKGHSRFVTCAIFSKDSDLLVTGSFDKSVIIWSLNEHLTLDSKILPSCNISYHFTNVKNYLTSRNISSAQENKYKEFKVIQKLSFTSTIKSIQFLNNDILAVADGKKTVEIWEKQLGKISYRQKEIRKDHELSVNHLDVLPESSKIISCSTDGMLVFWDTIMNLTHKIKISSRAGCLRICKFSPNSKYISAAGDDQEVYLWDASNLEYIKNLQKHDNAISAIAFTPDSEFLVSTCYGGDVILQNLEQEKFQAKINNAHDLGVTCCDFSSMTDLKTRCTDINSKQQSNRIYLLATGGNDSLVKLWEVGISKILISKTLQGHGGPVNCVKFSPAEPYMLASCSCDTTVRIWDTKTKNCLHVLNHHRGAVTTCSFYKDSTLFATGSMDKCVLILNMTENFCFDPKKLAHTSNKLLENWTTLDIANWFMNIGCPDIAEKIKAVNLSSEKLFSVSVDKIVESLSLESNEERKKLKLQLQSLKKNFSFPPDITYKNTNAPHKFLCPITHQIMRDPVICSDGYTYDSAALSEWFICGKLISPVTKESLTTIKLIPYTALKINIYEFLYEKKGSLE